MSKRVRFLFRPRALVIVLAALFASSCVSIKSGKEPDPEAYKTPVAQALEAGLQPYWLGQGFEAGGLSFDTIEAEFPQGAVGQRVDGVEITYAAVVDYQGKGSLDLLTFSRDHRAMAQDAIRSPQGIVGDSNDVRVLGRDAELISFSTGTRPVNAIYVAIDMGDQVLLAQTHSSSTGGRGGVPDVNPLINEQTLLGVLENLRPYPE